MTSRSSAPDVKIRPKTIYHAKISDQNQIVKYTLEENETWQELIRRQTPLVRKLGCREYISGLDQLKLPENRIPQCPEVSLLLKKQTGWVLEPVSALIPIQQFFGLLAQKKFPAATFIRTRDELNYVQEPDIFHEIFGHCPLLTHPDISRFAETFGRVGLKLQAPDQLRLSRLYWFTVEFGLIRENDRIKAMGGGILSSIKETQTSTQSLLPIRKPFTVLDTLRTSFEIDRIQPLYFVLQSLQELAHLTENQLVDFLKEAKDLGDFEK